MIELETEYISYADYVKLFDALKFGGYVRVGKFGFKIDLLPKYIKVAIVVNGKEIDEKVYFKNMSSERRIKKKQEKEVIVNPEYKKPDTEVLF